MEPERTTFRSLRTQLRNSMVQSLSQHYFLPNTSLDRILTLSTVEGLVEELDCPADERIALSGQVYHEGRRIFAMLILMGEEASIVAFRNHNALDHRLPLGEAYAKEIAPDFGISLAREFQWKILPFHFTADMWQHHWEVEKERILPFVESEDIAAGGFGDIYKVTIWPSQQDFFPKESSQVQVIRKRLRSKSSSRAFNQEKLYLRLLHQLSHPNIIPLLASYTYHGEFNFLFPCVDMDLRQFFRSERFGMFTSDFTFYSALRGLSSAISKLHRLYLNRADHKMQFEAVGYHHDIRPANILVSSETFILADFGMGNYKPVDAQSQTPWKWAVGDYLAPECMDENHKPQDVGRAIDVWAFGCLLAEVVTYMLMGADGVKEFRIKRDLPGRVSGWNDCGFYRPDGDVKDIVKDWLGGLVRDSSPSDLPQSLLIKISLLALTGAPNVRPKIDDICAALSVASLKAHFGGVDQQFVRHAAPDSRASHTPGSLSTNNLWFLQERFRAWGHALMLQKIEITSQMSSTIDELHNKSIRGLVAILQVLEKGPFHGAGYSSDDEQRFFESAVDELIEALWDLLPAILRRRAENCWHQTILRTNDIGILEGVQHKLETRYTVYNITSAMAMMKKIRLEMLQPDSFEASAEACTLSLNDVNFNPDQRPHVFGLYKGRVPVLIERIRYAPGWGNVNPVQRALVTSLKAKGYGIEPKPKGLRLMRCIGAFAENSEEAAYGFVYELPSGIDSAPRTLIQYLEQGEAHPKDQPPLGEKFQLAYALADFLQQFHTIGWLHENFNPQNILFFTPPILQEDVVRTQSSIMICSPYIVGLHKSRPDGDFWQTSGPHPDDSLHDYQHPVYSATGRYHPSYDYYSLGIVLLEVGLWRPLKSVLSSKRFQSMGATEIRSELLAIVQTRLGPRMGAAYRDAVLRCMDGSLEFGLDSQLDESNARDAPRSDANTTIFEMFIERVIEPLERLAVAPI